MAFLVLMIIAVVAGVGVFAYATYGVRKLIKNPVPKTNNYPKEVKKLTLLNAGSAVAISLALVFNALYREYALNVGEWFELVIGGLVFAFSLTSFVHAFVLHYYGKEKEEKLDKGLFAVSIGGVVTTLLGLIIFTNGMADYLTYPLPNGLSFSKGLVSPTSGGKPSIAWYAICILSGAVLVYFICDHRLYREYGKHGIVESTFLVAFPAGIIGARIGYVIGEWNHGPHSFADRVASGEWWAPFAIWEGGLTIISGALIGIVVGVAWFMWRNKKYSIWVAVDIIVPTILIAQGIGRWGNFFNCEVHGFEVNEAYWKWLPKIVYQNIHYSEAHGFASSGKLWLPLFFVEFATNFIGYFLIRFGVGEGLKKQRQLGDLAFLYIFWYGLTRVIMEPLRDSSYNMGNDGYWSWFWSFVFVAVAALCICVNHVVRYLVAKKKKTYVLQKKSLLGGSITSGAFLVVALGLIIPGIIMMSGNEQSTTIAFNPFNIGLILLMLGIAFILMLGTSLPYVIEGLKKKKETVVNE